MAALLLQVEIEIDIQGILHPLVHLFHDLFQQAALANAADAVIGQHMDIGLLLCDLLFQAAVLLPKGGTGLFPVGKDTAGLQLAFFGADLHRTSLSVPIPQDAFLRPTSCQRGGILWDNSTICRKKAQDALGVFVLTQQSAQGPG